MRVRRHTLVTVALFGSLLVPVLHATEASATNANARPDFDNDGFADLVIADSRATVNTFDGAGGVHVLYGSSSGPRAMGSQFWTQDSPGVPDAAEAGDSFGWTWAAGDFNGDSFDDLAIGVGQESVPGVVAGGMLVVLYGDTGGLQSRGAQAFDQNSFEIPSANDNGDAFAGASMVVDDFDGDGRDDLAIGVPYEDVSGEANAGAVFVLYGSPSGLSGYDSDMFTHDTPGIAGLPDASTFLSTAQLAAGDFDGDGRDDLAVPYSYGWVNGMINAGGFYVLYGTSSGLTGTGSDYFTQDTAGVPGVAANFDFFAFATAAGDFDDDGYDDLAVSAPYETIGGDADAGEVYVFRGGPGGITTSGLQRFSQDTPGVAGSAENLDKFGYSNLTAADFDGDGHDDLAVGISNEDLAGNSNAGALAVFYGGPTGISAAGNEQFTQDSPGFANQPESNDMLTENGMVGADYDGDGNVDLAVPVPYEDLGAGSDVGGVHVVFGGAGGLSGSGSVFVTRGTPGIVGINTVGHRFGLCCY